MPWSATFHMVLHSLPKYLFKDFEYTKVWKVNEYDHTLQINLLTLLQTEQTISVRAAWSGSTLLLFDLILYVPSTIFQLQKGQVFLAWASTKLGLMFLLKDTMDLTSIFFVLCTKIIYIIILSGWSLTCIFLKERVNKGTSRVASFLLQVFRILLKCLSWSKKWPYLYWKNKQAKKLIKISSLVKAILFLFFSLAEIQFQFI